MGLGNHMRSWEPIMVMCKANALSLYYYSGSSEFFLELSLFIIYGGIHFFVVGVLSSYS